jgi:two-component sensor histidine kinase
MVCLLSSTLVAQRLGVDHFFDSIYVAAHTLHDTERVRSYCNMASMVITEDAQLARRFLDTAKIIYARHPTLSNELKIEIEEGAYCQNVAQYEEAYMRLKKAVLLADKMARHEYACDLRTQIGDVLMQMERFEEAEAYYLESFNKIKALEASYKSSPSAKIRFTDVYYLYSLVHLKLAACYAHIPNKSPLIEQNIQSALNNGEKVHPVIAADAHLAFANYYIGIKDASKATASIAKLEAIFVAQKAAHANQISWQFQLPYLKGLLAKLEGQNDVAMGFLNQAVVNFEKGGDVKLLSETYKALAEVHQAKGDWQKAFAMQAKFIVNNDSLKRKSAFQTINNLEAKYQNTQKQAQIDLLAKQTETQRKAQIYLIIGLILAVVSAGFAYFSFVNKRKLAATLAQSNREKEVFLKEIHHRVKNNLQIISSLLYLQFKDTEDEKMLTQLKQAQDRIKSMSLVHNKLYETSDVVNVKIKEYMSDLAVGILSSNTPAGKQIQLSVEADETISFSLDTSISLGLMLNELITNSCKYAFTAKDQGVIRISMVQQGDQYVLEVKDDGSGLADNFDQKNSLGLKLVKNMARQMRGKVRFLNDNGTLVQITLNKMAA